MSLKRERLTERWWKKEMLNDVIWSSFNGALALPSMVKNHQVVKTVNSRKSTISHCQVLDSKYFVAEVSMLEKAPKAPVQAHLLSVLYAFCERQVRKLNYLIVTFRNPILQK